MKQTIFKSITAIICVAIFSFSLISGIGTYADAVKQAAATAGTGAAATADEADVMDDFFGDDGAATDAPVADDGTATDAPAADAPAAGDTAADPNAQGNAGTAGNAGTSGNAGQAAAATSLSKAEFVALLNAETAKIVKSGTYNFNRKCEYTSPIDVGNATKTLNGIISAIDKNSNLDTVVGGFLGIGTKEGAHPKDELSDNYKIKATTLKESDFSTFTAKNGVYTFTLPNATNPKKTNETPLARFTNDFITHEEIVNGIADFTSAIKVNSTTINYKSVKVAVTVANNKITDIKYAYSFDAQLALKAVVTINGQGAAVTTATYSNIKY